jgi:hypothetical protein
MKDKKDKKRKTDISFEPPPLPSEEDKLFDTGEDWWHNACLNYMHDGWPAYVIGYKNAADILVDYIKEKRRSQDTLVFPILFLYRQYLELFIKNLIQKGRHLQDICEPTPQGHNIHDLWRTFEKIMEGIAPGDSVEEIKQINRLISEFCAVDPKATAFRYPEDKKGNPSLPGMKHINIRNVNDVIEKISVILEGADALLSEYLSLRAETENDYHNL